MDCVVGFGARKLAKVYNSTEITNASGGCGCHMGVIPKHFGVVCIIFKLIWCFYVMFKGIKHYFQCFGVILRHSKLFIKHICAFSGCVDGILVTFVSFLSHFGGFYGVFMLCLMVLCTIFIASVQL